MDPPMATPSIALLQACCQRCEPLTSGACGAAEGAAGALGLLLLGYGAEPGGYCTATGSQPNRAKRNTNFNAPNRSFIVSWPRGKSYFIPASPPPLNPPLQPAARRPQRRLEEYRGARPRPAQTAPKPAAARRCPIAPATRPGRL